MSFLNPISPIQVGGQSSVSRTSTFGTTFSNNVVGGYMQVNYLTDLIYTIPTGATGNIEYSGNTIPINFIKGTGSVWSPDVLTLNSDNLSSGRRKIGMLVYVKEQDQTYQYNIDNYDSIWSVATASTGTVVISDFGTTVNNFTAAGQNFINAWTGSTIEGVNGVSRQTANWRKYYRTQQFINNLSTGLFYFTGITITSLTTFSVSPVKGWIVNNEFDTMNPTITYVEYSGQTGLTTPYLSSATITYISLTSGGTITLSSTAPTTEDQRKNIYLGKIGHANLTSLIQAFNEPDYVQSPISQLRDMFEPIQLINSGVYPSSNGANLNFNTSAGNLYGLGINYINNLYSPNNLTVGGQSPATFQYRTQTGGTTANVTLIDPTNYDNGGVITTVGGGTNNSTNQRIFLTQNGTIRVQYGQQIYSDLPTAIAAANTESFVTFSNFRDNAVLIGILSVRHTATNLSSTSQARFLLTSKFGETIGASGGISTTTLQQAYNNSSTPEIVTDGTLGAVSIKNGTGNADNVTNLLEGQNTAGSITSFIRADGLISGSSFTTQSFTANTNGLTATTVSATTYLNLPLRVSGTGTQDYVTKWDGSTVGLVDSQIYDTGAFIGIATTSPQYGETFSIQTSNKGITIDDLYIRDAGGSLAFGTNFDYSTWGSGGGEIAIGTRGVLSNSTGTGNIGIGDKALENNLTGNGNIAIGATGALFNNITGSSNIAIGQNAMLSNTEGQYNVAIGEDSLFTNIDGNNNTVLGYGAGYSNLGKDNVYIGYSAGYNNSGNGNIFIGNAAGYSDTSSSGKLDIGGIIFGNLSSGFIGIGQPSPVTTLDVNGTTRITGGLTATTISGNSLTLSNSASTIYLNNTTSQQIKFYDGGRGTPSYNSYSAGAKIIFTDNISSISTGHAIGVDAGSLWYGSDLAGNGHDWYAGTNRLMSLISSSGLRLFGLGGPTTTAMVISGTSALGSKGGVGYMDFLQVVNNWSGATNVNKWFRTNSTGGLEILNNAYTATILTISDSGIMAVGGGNPATSTSQDATSNYLTFNNNNTQIYDDGNTHIHSRGTGQSMWINTNGGQLNLLTQSPTATGGIGSGIAIATGTLNGYVTINTGRTVTTAAAYGYLTTGGAGTYPGGLQTISISLYANNRIWGQEIDAFSDERMKDIHGEITLEEGIKLVKNLKPIKYNWKEGDDRGIKAGYSAQQVIKSGFDHLIGLIPTEGLEETIDEDGFLSPKDTQFAMNYDQVTPYHGVVIKHLLEKIEQLENRIKDLENK